MLCKARSFFLNRVVVASRNAGTAKEAVGKQQQGVAITLIYPGTAVAAPNSKSYLGKIVSVAARNLAIPGKGSRWFSNCILVWRSLSTKGKRCDNLRSQGVGAQLSLLQHQGG